MRNIRKIARVDNTVHDIRKSALSAFRFLFLAPSVVKGEAKNYDEEWN
jgi:hypothetical protein